MRKQNDPADSGTRVAWVLAALFMVDRALKLAAIWHFMRRPPPRDPAHWPAVSIIQPITRGTHTLRDALAARSAQDYPGQVQHVAVCDAADLDSRAICQAAFGAVPESQMTVIAIPGQRPASKIIKMRAGAAEAKGNVIVFVDDDVTWRPDTLRTLVAAALEPAVGGAFGIACYSNWGDPWSGLMSAFVNTQALFSYLPLTYLTDPYTITGHCFAMRRDVFVTCGGLDGMEERLDDDHELARRVRAIGHRTVQTPAIYDVDNRLPTFRAYLAQMHRWFVIPRLTMIPQMTTRERVASGLLGIGSLIPGTLLGVAIGQRRRGGWSALAVTLGAALLSQRWVERRYLARSAGRSMTRDDHPPAPDAASPALIEKQVSASDKTPHWLLVLAALIFAPWQGLASLTRGATIEWRGQQLRLYKGGRFEVIR